MTPTTIAAGYGGVALVTFVGLTAYWARVKRPMVRRYGSVIRQWNDGEVLWNGFCQALLWPPVLSCYALWGLCVVAERVGRAYLGLVKPKIPTPEVKAAIAARNEIKDPYLIAAEQEVEKALEDPWAGR